VESSDSVNSSSGSTEKAASVVSYELGGEVLSEIANLSTEVADAILAGSKTQFASAVVDAEMANLMCEEGNPAMSKAQNMLFVLDRCEMGLRVAIRSQSRQKMASAAKEVADLGLSRFLQVR
jgi:hypothetical protein